MKIKKEILLKNSGFTMIEAMVVMAILGIIASLAYSHLSSNSYRVASTARNIMGDIQRARLIAINENLQVRLQPDTSSSYQICRVDPTTGNIIVPCDATVQAPHTTISFGYTDGYLLLTPQGTSRSGNIQVTGAGSDGPTYFVRTNNSGKARLEKSDSPNP